MVLSLVLRSNYVGLGFSVVDLAFLELGVCSFSIVLGDFVLVSGGNCIGLINFGDVGKYFVRV